MSRRFLLLLLGLWPLATQAQYHLMEFGARADGIATPVTSAGGGVGGGARLSGFYSHYFCGKSFGYHLEAGAGFLAQPVYEATDTKALLSADYDFAPNTQSLLATGTAAAYFKLRRMTYHQKREGCLLLGWRATFLFGERTKVLNVNGSEVFTSEISAVLTGPEVVAQYRMPRGKKQSWLLQAGVHLPINADVVTYQTNLFPADPTVRETHLQLWLGFGLTLWDNR
jgi:hypothetical protein